MNHKRLTANDKQMLLWKYLPSLLGLWLLITGCERRALIYTLEAKVNITADWSCAGLDDESSYGATAIFYPQDGGTPTTVLLGDRSQGDARLKEGRYNVVLFNRSFDDFSGIAFRGIDAYETLEVFAKKVDSRATTRYVAHNPERLAIATQKDFEVTAEMIGNYITDGNTRTSAPTALHLTPVPLTQTVHVTARIEGLSRVKEASCTLDGLPVSVLVSTGALTSETAVQNFMLHNPAYDSAENGTITGTFNVFGFDRTVAHNMTLTTLLLDSKTVITQEFNEILIREEPDETGSVTLVIDAVAPEKIPDIAVGGGGIDADVEDWGDEQYKELPI